ncbi:MAG: FHA domain-containing protein [Anaerolineales bacterium]|nr:FHA domain-containing protein [Anaerolineales bacterium]
MRIPGWMPAAAVLAALWLSLLPPTPGQAQAPVQVDLAPPDVSGFPDILLYVTARPIAGSEPLVLAPQDFVILEDQTERPLTSMEIVQAGLDLRLVLNTTHGMGLRDSGGRSRFDRVREALVRWWSEPLTTQFGTDSYSLITREGTILEGLPAAAELASTIDYLQPSLTATDTALDLLTRVLEQARPTPPPGTPRVLVFVTPFVDIAEDLGLANVVAAAQETSTAVYPVIVGPAALAEDPALEGWRTLAQQTGGGLTLFDPAAGFDALAQELDQSRTRYRLSYPSAASSQGAHSVQVRLLNETLDEISPVRTFRADVLPPEVVFVSPPASIVIDLPQPGQSADGLDPQTVTLPLLITFPDNHPRPIVETELLVDGVLTASKVQPPFDVLTWSVGEQSQASDLKLQAAVTDSLGLRGLSEPVSVRLEAFRAPSVLETRPWLIGLMGLLLAATAAAVGLLPRVAARRPSATGLRSAPPRLRRASLAPAAPDQAEARLQPVEGDLDPILLTGTDITIGRDASLVTQVVFDPSVSAVHARLIRQVHGRYLLRDQDSLAGTWVNHEEVPQAGRALEHGDLVHFGRLGYRFLMTQEPADRQIVVSPQAETGPSPALRSPGP